MKKTNIFIPLLCLLLLTTCTGTLFATTINVSSLAALQTAIDGAAPGDVIVLANGVYNATADITISKQGTAALPITITAQTTAGAEITGAAGFNIASPAAYIVIKGFKFTCSASKVFMAGGTSFCRWTHNLFQCPGEGEYLLLNGSDHQVDYNTFQHKNTLGRFIAVRGTGSQIGAPVECLQRFECGVEHIESPYMKQLRLVRRFTTDVLKREVVGQ